MYRGVYFIIKQILLQLGLFGLLSISPALAATDLNLYQERVVVSQNADRQEQDEAIAEAFERLIIRVTGITQSLQNDAIQRAMSRGANYLATFRFEPSDEFFTNVLGEQIPTKAMIMQFDESSVDELLVQNRLPVWGSKRPDVLIWLADRLEGQEHILTDAENSELSQLLTEEAETRGIPYLLPIGDLSDSLSLNFSELYGLFSRDIETASERYQHDAILAGRIMAGNEPNQFLADWLMLFKGERLRLPTVSGTLDDVIAQGIDLVSQRLSEQYALLMNPMQMGSLSVNVLGVDGLSDFSALESYLQSINIITRVTLSSFSDESVVFNIEISGDRSQLADVLELENQLIPVEESTLDAQLDNRLVYRWQSNK